MMDAIRATAGLAMSTFKDDKAKVAVDAGVPEEELVNVESHWKPTPELKARMYRPVESA